MAIRTRFCRHNFTYDIENLPVELQQDVLSEHQLHLCTLKELMLGSAPVHLELIAKKLVEKKAHTCVPPPYEKLVSTL